MNIADRLYAQARIIPVKRENKVKTVTKLESGDLQVTQHSGHSFTISKDDETFQAFVVYTVLNTQVTD
jgi:hypothetical protein